MKYLFGTILFVLTFAGVQSQCTLEGPFTVNDFDVIELELEIAGLQNNDLSSATQGICGIAIEFEHERVSNLLVEVESPSGQVITLIGPPGPFGPTNFTNWDISFVPCGSTASPDGGFGPFWTNQNNWANFGNYDGSYYPFMGCLEDFNTGNANGTWTFTIRDAFQFDQGVIENITLFFCDPTGVDCEYCQPGEIGFEENSKELCEDELPLHNIDYEWTGIIDSMRYNYSFLLLQSDTIIRVLDSAKIENIAPGDYELCGLTFQKSDSVGLFSIVDTGMLISTLLDSIEVNDLCASTDENCLPVSVIPLPDTLQIDTSFCVGDTLLIMGDSIHQSGNYLFTDTSGICEQVVEFSVIEIRLKAEIEGLDTIDCTHDSLVVNALPSDLGPNTQIFWYAGKDLLASDTTHVEIQNTGTYRLILQEGDCTDTLQFEIEGDFEPPYFELNEYDSLSCQNTSIIVFPDSTHAVDWVWLLPMGDTVSTDSLVVTEEGRYTYVATGKNGCITMDSFYVHQAGDIFRIEIDSTINLCGTDTIFLGPNEVFSNLNYRWEGPGGFSAFVPDTFALAEGTYSLTVTDSNSICEATDSITFLYQPPLATPVITSDSLGCQVPEVQIRLDTIHSAYSYNWISPSSDTLLSPEPFVVEDGKYLLIISNGNNCFVEVEHSVVRTNEFPSFSIVGDTLSCTDTAATLRVSLSEADTTISYQWTDPLGNISDEDSLITSIPGKYKVLLQSGETCQQRDSFLLIEEFLTFDHQFQSDTLTCNDNMINISITGPDSFQYVWKGPDGSLDTGRQLNTNKSGTFIVEINDGNCQYQRGLTITEDRDTPEVDLEINHLDCENDTAKILITSNERIESFYFDSDSGRFIQLDTNRYLSTDSGSQAFRFEGMNGCVLDTTIEIGLDTSIPAIQVHISDTLDCRLDTVQLTLQPESEIRNVHWLQNGDTLSNNVSVLVSNASDLGLHIRFENGCSIDSIMGIPIDTLPPNLTFDPLPINCKQDLYKLSIQSDRRVDSFFIQSPSLQFSMDSASFVVSESGQFSIRAFADNGCFADTSFIVPIDTGIPPLELYNDTIACGDDRVQIMSRTDTQFIEKAYWWLENGDSLSGLSVQLPPGQHQLIVRGNNGCMDTIPKEILLDDYQAIVQGVPDTFTLICDSPEVVIRPEILSDYDSLFWYEDQRRIQDSLPIKIARAGSFYLELIKNNCRDTVFTHISIDTLSPEIELMGDSLGCQNPSTTLTFNTNREIRSVKWMGPGGYTDSTRQVVVSDTGIYTLQLVDGRGCENSDRLKIEGDFEKPGYTLADTFYRNCESGNTSLYVLTDASNTLNWYADNQALSSLDSFSTDKGGIVFLVIEGSNGCKVSDSTRIEEEGFLPKADWAIPLLDCNNPIDTLQLKQSNGKLTFEWIGPGNFVSNFSSPVVDTGGMYVVQFKNKFDCTNRDTLEVIQSSTVIKPDFKILDPIRCKDSTTSIQVQLNRGLEDTSVLWRALQGQILGDRENMETFVRGPGLFEVEIHDPIDNCTTKDTLVLDFSPPVDLMIDTSIKQLQCEADRGGEVLLIPMDDSRAPFRYQLDNEMLTDTPLFTGLPAGLFRFTVYDRQFCEKEHIIEIDVEDADFRVELGPDREETIGTQITLSPEIAIDPVFIDSIIWFVNRARDCGGCDSLNLFLEAPKVVEIRVYTTGGCVLSDEIIIEVPTDDVLFIPNVFSPNEDGNNDFFFIQTALEIPEIELLEIYGRGGNRVFQARNFPPNDILYGWDGSFEGQELTPQVFAVKIIYTFEGERRMEHYDLTLIR